MNKKRGITLVSFIGYLCIFTIIVTLCFDWAITVLTNQLSQARLHSLLVSAYISRDIFVRDIHSAPSDSSLWKVITSTMLVWQVTDIDIGWRFKDNKLTRIEGIYNTRTQSWKKKTESTAISNIASVSFSIKKRYCLKKSRIKQALITLTTNNKGKIHSIMGVACIKNEM